MTIRIISPSVTTTTSIVPEYYGELASAPTGTPVDNSGYADLTIMRLMQFYTGVWHQRYVLSSLPTSAPGALVGQPMGLLMALTYS